MNTTLCFSCKATVPEIDGATHPYILSSPGCWKFYGEVLAKEYTPTYYNEATHRITVDTYAVTHPGNRNNRKAVRSVNIHLISLHSIFEEGFTDKETQEIIKQAAENKKIDKEYMWLNPPSFNETLKITDVMNDSSPAEHNKIVRDWGQSVWNIWKTQHETTIKTLANFVLNVRK